MICGSPDLSTVSLPLDGCIHLSASVQIAKSFDMLNGATTTALIVLRNPASDFVNMRARHPLAPRHKRRTIAEQLVHILQIKTFGLWLEAPEEDGVEEVTDDEDEVEFLANVSVTLLGSDGGRRC